MKFSPPNRILFITGLCALLLLSVMVAGSSVTAASLKSKVSNPEAAAKGLYNAWKRNNRTAALKVAYQSAVRKLFRQRWTGPDLQFMGCENRARGFDCFYYYEGGGLTMRVEGGAKAGYKVSRIEWKAD